MAWGFNSQRPQVISKMQMKKREYTGEKRWVYFGKRKTLQSQVKHWDTRNPTKVFYTWEDIKTIRVDQRED